MPPLSFEDVAVALDALKQPTDLTELFRRPGPVELEIGCGKGGFLLRHAQAHPERNYLGIEWANKFYKFAADRMARWGLTNVRILRADAKHFVMHRLAPDCLAALHVYHPDPWPKKRHHKRRLITPEFAAAAARALRPGAFWAVQTDHAEYFQQMQEVIAARPELAPVDFSELGLTAADLSVDSTDDAGEAILATNFEIKYRREGRLIYRAAWRRL